MTNAVPFTNEFGTVNPGDPCIVITKCTGTVRVTKGTYLGLSKSGGVQARVPNNGWGRYDYKLNKWVKPPEGSMRTTTLIANRVAPTRG